tara:strand:+ start:448 stop:606 length:159 start_codon:yes stop_codon:yes gene_type:complete
MSLKQRTLLFRIIYLMPEIYAEHKAGAYFTRACSFEIEMILTALLLVLPSHC